MKNKVELKREINPFSKMEEDVLAFWDENKIFEKSVEKDAPKGDYVFNDGPPFITGLPHYATLLPSIAKDVIPRYQTMNGFRVRRVWGWDCHGLPAENRVEKDLNLKNKDDIEKIGIDKFVGACRNYVSDCSDQWKWYINRIGRWVDMDNSYRTMDLEYMESVMWAFKELYNKGYIYEGYRTSLHCPRCATPLSKFEITMDAGSYRDVTDKTAVVKFKVKKASFNAVKINHSAKDGELYLLAWTTTPWTLPGNLALAVGADLEYVKVRADDQLYVIAKERVEEIFQDIEYKIVDKFAGSDLVGLEYENLYELDNDKIKNSDQVYKVYSADFVTTDDGTGIVHIAPNFGEDDFELSKEIDIPIIDLMNDSGAYLKVIGKWEGFYFKKANRDVLIDLEERKIIFSKFDITHSYPHCYRCGTPLIFKTQKAWYMNIEKVRQKMLDKNREINWVPEYFKEGRFKYNLEKAPDWCLSRSRYWGSPMPIWRCAKCKAIKVVGSIKEIEDLSGEEINDLHRPIIDEPEFQCQCGGKMKRVPEVLDCWFESGSMPFAQFHYPFNHKEEFKSLFPADFIFEYTGQLRGWFYYLHVLSNALFDSVSFKNVIVSGVLSGTDGRKMSKSFGNYPDPKMVLDKYGSDALRIYFMSSHVVLGDDMAFSEQDVKDALRKNIILLWNVVKFYEIFSNKSESDEIKDIKIADVKNILDIWILSRLNELIVGVTQNMEAYNLPASSKLLTVFISDLSTWYIRRSRDRFKGDDEQDKQAALQTTRYVLLQLSKVIAPFMPFIAEQVWQKVTGNNFKSKDKSVHLEGWPDNQLRITNYELRIIEDIELVRKIVELGLAARDEAGIKVRQPLNQLSITTASASEAGQANYQLRIEYEYLVRDELNVKHIKSRPGDGEMSVKLDAEITDKLRIEGVKREMVRLINNIRKNMGLVISDGIKVYFETESKDVKTVVSDKKLKAELLKDILADEITEGIPEDIENTKEVKVNNEKIIFGVVKI